MADKRRKTRADGNASGHTYRHTIGQQHIHVETQTYRGAHIHIYTHSDNKHIHTYIQKLGHTYKRTAYIHTAGIRTCGQTLRHEEGQAGRETEIREYIHAHK